MTTTISEADGRRHRARSARAVAVLSAALLLSSRGLAHAAIDSTTGAAVKVAAPASVVENAYESDTEIRAFDERQAVTLEAPLAVDITDPGTYDGSGPLTPGTIPAGTVVDSHLLHADPIGSPDPQTPVTFQGGVTFTGEILGVIVVDTPAAPHLMDSDILGATGTAYPTDPGGRGLELADQGGGDSIVVADAHTLSVTLVMHRYDEIRVITRAVPPPTTTTTTIVSTTTTVPSTTTTTVAPTTTTTVPTAVLGEVLTKPEPLATLPRTGSSSRRLVVLGIALALGGLAIRSGNRRPDES